MCEQRKVTRDLFAGEDVRSLEMENLNWSGIGSRAMGLRQPAAFWYVYPLRSFS
jgi:hypothetical protein